MRLLLIGNYGVGNLGDEALRDYFMSVFPEHEWTVVTAAGTKTGEVPRLPCGLRSLFLPWWKTLGEFMRADAVVFGGGSLFTDVESVKAPLIWGWHALWALIFRKPVILAFQGIGPARRGITRKIIRFVLDQSSYISVRDERSLERILDIAGNRLKTKPVRSFDPVLASIRPSGQPPENKLVLIPRHDITGRFFDQALEAVRENEWDRIVLVLMDPKSDRGAAEKLRTALSPHSVEITETASMDELIRAVSGARLVVTQRFHGGITAMGSEVPFLAVPQSVNDKLSILAGQDVEECRRLIEDGQNSLKIFLDNLSAE